MSNDLKPPVEQPEQDDGVPECNGSHDAGQIAAGDAECTACAGEHPAPSPADERAAFEDAFRAAHEFPEHADQLTFRKGWESAIMWQRRARAASANETGAEVAQWQSRLKGRSSPVVDHWVNISPDGAKTLMEKYADVYEVRALYTAPRSPAVAAEPAASPAANSRFNMTDAALKRFGQSQYRDGYAQAVHDLKEASPAAELARATSSQAHPGQPEPRECRHCGWMCIPNSTPSTTHYPLPQPEPSGEVMDTVRVPARVLDLLNIINRDGVLKRASELQEVYRLIDTARTGDEHADQA